MPYPVPPKEDYLPPNYVGVLFMLISNLDIAEKSEDKFAATLCLKNIYEYSKQILDEREQYNFFTVIKPS